MKWSKGHSAGHDKSNRNGFDLMVLRSNPVFGGTGQEKLLSSTAQFQWMVHMQKNIIKRCEAKGLRMTGKRRIIAAALEESADHPDVEELYNRANRRDSGISIATVYRTVKLFEEAGILDKLEFGDGRARYEDAERDHHDHLIDLNTGEVIEFVDPEIEKLQERIAARLGYRLKDHRLELYGVPIGKH